METIQRHDLHRTQPAANWLEGIPAGNGTLGAMAYGGPRELTFALDRPDLWCAVPGPARRRLIAGFFRLEFATATRFAEGLDLAEAVAFRETGNSRCEWFVHAAEPVLCVRILRPESPLRFTLLPPEVSSQAAADARAYSQRLAGKSGPIRGPAAGRSQSTCAVRDGAATMTVAIDGCQHAQVRVAASHHGAAVPIAKRGEGFEIAAAGGDELLLLVTVHPLAAAAARPARVEPDWPGLRRRHRAWWADFWGRSSARLSNPVLDRLWHLGTYHLGCTCRQDSLPIGLQGVWGVNGLPPWNGAYTWDLNVQVSYWPIYTGNHLELGRSLYDWYFAKLPLFQEYARRAGGEGAALCLQSDEHGQATLPVEKQLRPADGAWVCHNFWQHFLYTQDREFLRDRCLPVFREHLKFQRSRWQPGPDHRYHLAPASSPELDFLATPECPCHDPAYEIAFGRFLAAAYRQTVTELGLPADDLAAWAADFRARVVDYPTARTHTKNYYWPEDPAVPDFFTEWPGLETQMSHRHFSHLAMLYPLGEIHRFSPYPTLRTAQNTLHMLILRGQGGWAGFSFPWASLLATHAAWPLRMPAHMLETFARTVVVPFNGLTLNEDYRRLGTICQTGCFGPFHVDDFSIESSLMAVTAVQDMLLHAAGDHLVFGGGVPPELDGEFHGLRSPSGDLVSGTIAGGQLVAAALAADRPGTRQLALSATPANWQVKTPTRSERVADQSVLRVTLAAGDTWAVRRD